MYFFKNSLFNRRDFLKLCGTALASIPFMNSGHTLFAKNSSEVVDAVIVGGGLSGLITAYLLRDYHVLVLEKNAKPGGRVILKQWNDFHYSMGAAYMGEPDDEMKAFFKELGIHPIRVPPPVDGMAYKGKIVFNTIIPQIVNDNKALRDLLKVSRKLKALNDEGIDEMVYEGSHELGEFSELDKISMHDWLQQERIHPLVQKIIHVENRGLFGVSNADFSFFYSIPEMAFNFDPGDIDNVEELRKELLAGNEEESELYTFKHGMSELINALSRRLKNRVRTHARVTKVTAHDDETVTVWYDHPSGTKKIRAHAVIMATPAPVTAKLVKRGLSHQVLSALRKIRYSSYITIALFLKKRVLYNSWLVACLDTSFSTLNDAIRTQVDPDYRGPSILGIALPPHHARDRSWKNLSDKALMKKIIPELENYFPNLSSLILGYDIERFSYAFPVFYPGYSQILRSLNLDESTKGPIFLAGDYMVYPTLGGAAMSGYKAYEYAQQYAAS